MSHWYSRIVYPVRLYPHSRRFATVRPPRPFKFHVGTSFAGKPDHPHQTGFEGFARDSPIAIWRDSVLQREKSVNSLSAGEDFFFVQEVGIC